MEQIAAREADLSATISALATPLAGLEDPAFAEPFDRWSSRKVILLGESSHGTSEFYRARAAITRRLVEHHGFDIIALEADWPDAAIVNRLVRGRPMRDGNVPFQRFPRWMWRNREFFGFVDWLKGWNADRSDGLQAGIYGLDMYSLNASIQALLDFLDSVDHEAAETARERYACLEPWTAGALRAPIPDASLKACEEAVIRQCSELLERRLAYEDDDPEAFLDATQNARLITAAERYYRAIYAGGASGWNLRDRHMFETLCHLLEREDSRAVVWAHNSHIGDARHTAMGTEMGELNLGQLCREKWGDAVALVGLGTHSGRVAAASRWNGAMEVKTLRPARPGSLEEACHASGGSPFLLDLTADPDYGAELAQSMLQRFVGVIYDPGREHASHYLQTRPGQQYDGWVWFDETSALDAPESASSSGEIPETWPTGL